MSEAQAEQRLKAARAKMLIKHPFFATLMMKMPMIIDRTVPTAGTDMKSIWVNPDFIGTVNDDVVMFVIAHEIGHVALEHGLRRQHRDPMLWNIAADYSWNLTLKDSGFKVWEHACCDEKYRGEDKLPMSADMIYRLIEQQQQQKSGGKGSGKPGPGEPGNEHHSPMLGDIKEPEERHDPVAAEKLSREIQQKVAQAANVARMMGNLPGAIERFVEEVLEPKVPWYDTLRHFMTETVPTDDDWSRRNRRFHNVYLPSEANEDALGEFIAIGDASGSCYHDMERYFAEFLAVAEDCRPEKIRLIWADTRVTHEQEFEAGDEIVLAPKGFGGTDMRVPLEHVEQFDPKVVVLFTDAYTPWPSEPPPYPLIVCCTTTAPVPIGEVVRI